MNKSEKYAVSVYEYRCRRCQEIFTDTFEKGFGILVGEMIGLNQSDAEIEEQKRMFEEENHDENVELLTERSELFKIHICKDGGRGLADLIGCEPAREVMVSKGKWRGQYRDHKKSNFTGRQKESPYNGY
jgi:hypothetical protein